MPLTVGGFFLLFTPWSGDPSLQLGKRINELNGPEAGVNDVHELPFVAGC